MLRDACHHGAFTHFARATRALLCASCAAAASASVGADRLELEPVSSIVLFLQQAVADFTMVRSAVVNALSVNSDSLAAVEVERRRAKDEVDAYLLEIVRSVERTQQRLHKEIDDAAERRHEHLRQLFDAKSRIETVIAQTKGVVAESDLGCSPADASATAVRQAVSQRYFGAANGNEQVDFGDNTPTKLATAVATEHKHCSDLVYFHDLLRKQQQLLPPVMRLLDAVFERFSLRFRRQFCQFDLSALSVRDVGDRQKTDAKHADGGSSACSDGSRSVSEVSAIPNDRSLNGSSLAPLTEGRHIERIRERDRRYPLTAASAATPRTRRDGGVGEVRHRRVQTPEAPSDLPFIKR